MTTEMETCPAGWRRLWRPASLGSSGMEEEARAQAFGASFEALQGQECRRICRLLKKTQRPALHLFEGRGAGRNNNAPRGTETERGGEEELLRSRSEQGARNHSIS